MSDALGFFRPSGDPNVDMATRRKIMMALMAQGKRPFPKNLGEGIASVGQEIGDYLAERSLLAQNAEENKAADAFKAKYTGVSPQAAAVPPESIPPAAAEVAPPTPPIVPASAPPPRTVRPPPQPIPPQDGTLGNRGDTVFPTRANGLVQPQSSPAAVVPSLPAPVMAQGGQPAAVPPDEESRRTVAHAMLRQQLGGAPPPDQPRPSVADFGQPSVLAATPPQAIPAAPPAAPVRAMPPPPQVTQGPQIVDPGPEPTPPRTMTDLQRQILQDIDKEPPSRRAGALAAVEPILQQEQAKIAQEQAIYQDKMKTRHEFLKLKAEQTYGAPKTAAETAKTLQDVATGTLEQEKKRLEIEDAREKSILQSRFGGRDPEKVFATFDADKESAKKATHALTQFSVAKDLLDKGVITGTGQGWKVSAAKLAGALGITSEAEKVARTEEMQAAIKSTLSIAIENIQGAGGKVSDTDVAIASGTIGADPTLQLDTIKNLVNRGEQAAKSKLQSYNEQVDTYLGGTRAEKRYRVQIPGSEAKTEEPKPKVADPLEGREALLPDKTIVVRRGGKWVPK